VGLLDGGATARVTEIAAKSLANLGSAPNNRTGIRLAGGIPPLVALLVEQPTPQVRVSLECKETLADCRRPDILLSLAFAASPAASRRSSPCSWSSPRPRCMCHEGKGYWHTTGDLMQCCPGHPPPHRRHPPLVALLMQQPTPQVRVPSEVVRGNGKSAVREMTNRNGPASLVQQASPLARHVTISVVTWSCGRRPAARKPGQAKVTLRCPSHQTSANDRECISSPGPYIRVLT